jgi:predicted MPP superfamily phosphohydrolase
MNQAPYQLIEQRQWGQRVPWWQEPFKGLSGLWRLVRLVVPMPHITRPITLLHLSDLHWDWNTQPWFEGLLPQLNQLAPCDAVLCTGDFIAGGAHGLADVAQWFASVQPTVPHIACLGNHDYYDRSGGKAIAKALQTVGVQLLTNAVTRLETPNNPSLQLAGIDDFVKGTPNPAVVFEALFSTEPAMLLVHNPTQVADTTYPWHRFGLMLSGHTHGGQFPCPEWFARIIAESPYVRGVYHPQADSLLYVNSASGTASLRCKVPLLPKKPLFTVPRWGMQPEVTLITLAPTNT